MHFGATQGPRDPPKPWVGGMGWGLSKTSLFEENGVGASVKHHVRKSSFSRAVREGDWGWVSPWVDPTPKGNAFCVWWS